jgi:hypothetical protein
MTSEADRAQINQCIEALFSALRPLKPIPAHVVIDAALKLLAAHIAPYPKDKRDECIADIKFSLEHNVDVYVRNPVLKVVRPS